MERRFFARATRPMALLIAFMLILGTLDADAKRHRRRRHRRHEPKVIAEKPLYDRMGGRKTLDAVIDDFVKRSAQDPRLASSVGRLGSSPAKVSRFKSLFSDRLCEAARGPCHYSGPALSVARQTLAMNDEQFVAAAESLGDALEDKRVPEREKNEFLALIGALRPDVVTGPVAILGAAGDPRPMPDAVTGAGTGVPDPDEADDESKDADAADDDAD